MQHANKYKRKKEKINSVLKYCGNFTATVAF